LPHFPTRAMRLSLGDTVFLSNRGITIPKFIWGDGAWLIGVAFLVAIAAIWLLRRWARVRQEATGEQFPVFLSVAWPADRPAAAGISHRPECRWSSNFQEKGTFNLRGGVGLVPEFAALFFALSIYTAGFIGEIVRAGILAVNKGQTEAAHALGIRPGADACGWWSFRRPCA
jgi:general L-amino acid transport system permease protein